MGDLQPMTVDSAIEPLGSTPEFALYDNKAQAYNQKISGARNTLSASQILQQAAQVLADNPQLVMA